MKILGLDIATKTGWALLTPAQLVTGVLDMNEPTKASQEPEGVRFRRLADRLYGLLDGQITAVGIEEAYSQGYRTAHVLGGLTAAVLVELERAEIEYSWAPANTLKKWATGTGRAGKERMAEALRARHVDLGVPKLPSEMTEDEVDAAWVALYTRDVLVGGGG